MKKIKRAIGLIMVALVLIGVLFITAQEYGLVDSLKAWGIAIGLTATIIIGMYLAFGDEE